MASVASSYARAFADVVLSAKLDANRAIAELRTLAGLLAESADLRRGGGNPAIPGGQKGGLLGGVAQGEGSLRPGPNRVAVLMDPRAVALLHPNVHHTKKKNH